MRWKVAVVLAAVFAGGSVMAQEGAQEADKVVFKKKTVIDFSDVTIEGDLVKPEGSYIVNRKKLKFRNLIQIRADFRPELMKSVDGL